jgi:hypothetical protein
MVRSGHSRHESDRNQGIRPRMGFCAAHHIACNPYNWADCDHAAVFCPIMGTCRQRTQGRFRVRGRIGRLPVALPTAGEPRDSTPIRQTQSSTSVADQLRSLRFLRIPSSICEEETDRLVDCRQANALTRIEGLGKTHHRTQPTGYILAEVVDCDRQSLISGSRFCHLTGIRPANCGSWDGSLVRIPCACYAVVSRAAIIPAAIWTRYLRQPIQIRSSGQ